MPDQDIPNVDADVTALSEDIRRDLATRGTNDLFFFARGILGYRDMTEACHGPMCVYLDHNPKRFKLLMYPRGHYKTSVATIARQLQKVCKNVNNRLLLANETSTNAERFLGAIKSHVEGNSRFRALYSSVIPADTRKVRWSNKELVFNRQWHGPEPTIDTIGMTGAWTSRHYTHITFDDPISEEAARSDSVMQDVIGRISKLFSLMTSVEVDTFDLIGTRWAFYDVYSYMMGWLGDRMAKMIRGAIEESNPIFPEKFSLETLADIRNSPKMGEYFFSCQYMNNPRNVELQDFNIQDLRFWRYSSDEKHVVLYAPDNTIHQIVPFDELDITVTLDPAPAETIRSDRNAITVTGTTPNGDIVVLVAWARRCTPLKVIEKLLEIKERFNPRVFGIEGVAYQKAFKYFLADAAERQGLYLSIVELKAPGKHKIHIRGLQPIAATGHLYIDAAMHELRNELAEFPLGEFDDLADSLALHQQLWQGLMSPDRWRKYKESERKFIRDIDGYGLHSERNMPDDYDEDDDDPDWGNVKIQEVSLGI